MSPAFAGDILIEQGGRVGYYGRLDGLHATKKPSIYERWRATSVKV